MFGDGRTMGGLRHLLIQKPLAGHLLIQASHLLIEEGVGVSFWNSSPWKISKQVEHIILYRDGEKGWRM